MNKPDDRKKLYINMIKHKLHFDASSFSSFDLNFLFEYVKHNFISKYRIRYTDLMECGFDEYISNKLCQEFQKVDEIYQLEFLLFYLTSIDHENMDIMSNMLLKIEETRDEIKNKFIKRGGFFLSEIDRNLIEIDSEKGNQILTELENVTKIKDHKNIYIGTVALFFDYFVTGRRFYTLNNNYNDIDNMPYAGFNMISDSFNKAYVNGITMRNVLTRFNKVEERKNKNNKYSSCVLIFNIPCKEDNNFIFFINRRELYKKLCAVIFISQ